MNIVESTAGYENWIRARIPLIETDLTEKHRQMAEKPFAFLRATFYRWAQVWREFCPDLQKAPQVLGIGDLHIENFGTWRDVEGRLVWGVNDFDEACDLPYPNDLVRLAVSAMLRKSKIPSQPAEICRSILKGYRESLEANGRPIVIGKEDRWLRDLVRRKKGGEPEEFWEKFEKGRNISKKAPQDVCKLLDAAMPEEGLISKIIHRQGGLGSLGRRRFTAIGTWFGAYVAREAKELVCSAWQFGSNLPDGEILYRRATEGCVRIRDPFLKLEDPWVIRRLSPDCSKVEFGDSLDRKTARSLMYSMGWETGNIHLGTQKSVRAILNDLKKRRPGWLEETAPRMMAVVEKDWGDWKRHFRPKS